MNNELLKQNYYKAVNEQWLEKAVIPGDQPTISAFIELHLGIEKTLMDLAVTWDKDQKGLNENLKKFVKLYKMTKDFETREKLGTKPIKTILDKLNQINTLKDLETNFKELALSSIDLPFMFMVMQDFMNSNNQILYFSASSLILPDTSYYKNEETKAQMLGLWQQTTTQLLTLYGYKEVEITKLISDAIKFDALLVPVTKSSVEAADYVKLYNPVKSAEVNKKATTFNLIDTAKSLVDSDVDQLIITNLDFLDAFNNIINEENFEIIKSWMLISNLESFATNLTDDLRIAGGAFRRALSGIKEAQSKEKAAFYSAYNTFSQVVGLYYGENYFGPKAKKDVEEMVYEMLGVYKERIQDNTWLNAETKAKAINKVEKLSVHVGYPNELPKYYDEFEIIGYDEGSNLLEEKLKISRILTLDRLNKYNKEPNRNLWQMPASMVNAYYSPQNNQIVFPAAILQEPYYSLNQTPSENYGGIGAVIAHEVSHAFDNNGAKFDETGSLHNWWTDEDLKAFETKSKDMIELFDGVETGYGKCNGELTVSENIADSGGLRCALEASKKQKHHNLEEFFKNWARVWRQKSHEKYSQLLLTVDVHGPSILRANMQLSNLEEFQDFYKLTEKDEMYLAKDKMVSIW